MSFSGKDDRSIGTASWQSEHHVAFTRLSLFHFGPIDEGLDIPDAKFEVIQQFKRVRVLWFCLVSSILTYTDVPSTRINHYVKLFLSSCRWLWQSTVIALTGDESTDPVITGDDGHVGSKKNIWKPLCRPKGVAQNQQKPRNRRRVYHSLPPDLIV